ncbi:TIGR02453 family protein [Chryseobacterium sp. HMWF028]|nr:TIGR02453 family protein [Chryseobacterium sp. HMWF028]
MKKAFEFLTHLKENNNREWFAKHKSEFDQIVKENKVFFNQIYTELQEHDQLKGIHIFRVYKDVRFSKDQTPYKTNFGVGYSRSKPMLRGGYYIQLEPGNSFVGGGFWGPEASDLLRIRKEFEISSTEIEKIISDDTFIKYFGELKGDSVKTAPRGFDKNHPSIDLIRKKQFLVMRNFTDKEVLSDNFQKEAILTLLAMRPFFDYMSEILTTDLNGEPLF